MSVYVDPLFDTRGFARAPRCLRPRACHLLADAIEELHEFATGIGMRRAWFQAGPIPHYDLSERRRARAVAAGAIEIQRDELVARIRRHRAEHAGKDHTR